MSRFATVSEADIEKLVREKDAKLTAKATEQSWRVFKSYCNEKCIIFDESTGTKSGLNAILKSFYAEVRKPDGKLYRKNSFNCLRHGINRKIKSFHEGWDIIHDPEFTSSGTIFIAQCTRLKREGLAKVEHYPPIDEVDLRKIRESGVLNIEHPKNLQWKVFFDVMFYLCRRGEENLRELTKHSFKVKTASDGVKYIEKVRDELSKNHRLNHENEDGGVITATGGDSCPVRAFELYISKLNPNAEALFQRSKKIIPNSGPWYDCQAIGYHKISEFMKNISAAAELSRIYTNHSIRATTITILDGKGYESRHIKTVSGHRSDNSIQSYCRTNLNTKRKMCEELSSTRNEEALEEEVPRKKIDFGIDFHKGVPEEQRPSSSSSWSGNKYYNCVFNIKY